LILGLKPRTALWALLASLIGSYVDILLCTVKSGPVPHEAMVNNFGVIYAIPTEYAGASTTVAINVGGALVPVLISASALFGTPSALLPSALGTAIVALVTHHFAYPMGGVGLPFRCLWLRLPLRLSRHCSAERCGCRVALTSSDMSVGFSARWSART
jgi:uncharacterized membrane protein